MVKKGTTIEQSIQTAIRQVDGLHWLNAPSRGNSIVLQIQGLAKHMATETNDDPLLYAYTLKDHLPQLAAWVIELQKWVTAVTTATPDALHENGAKLCP